MISELTNYLRRERDDFVAGRPGWLGLLITTALLLVLLATLSYCQSVPAAEPVDRVEVPAQQRITLTREAQRIWGPGAPVARFAAQIHAESTWRPDVCSRVGACGLGQFMPTTAQYLAALYPDHLKPVAIDDWRWSVRALVLYDRHLFDAEAGWERDSDRWAATLVSYVGGGGWVRRERRAAAAAGDNPDVWWRHVEAHCQRGVVACRESRHYPRRIMCQLEPRYIRAGWPGQAFQCEGP